MKTTVQEIRRFLVSEDGLTKAEYAAVIALIAIVCVTAFTAYGMKR